MLLLLLTCKSCKEAVSGGNTRGCQPDGLPSPPTPTHNTTCRVGLLMDPFAGRPAGWSVDKLALYHKTQMRNDAQGPGEGDIR